VDARLLRWEAATVVALPAGIGMLAFAVARSNQSVTRAVDHVEYDETAARGEDLLRAARVTDSPSTRCARSRPRSASTPTSSRDLLMVT